MLLMRDARSAERGTPSSSSLPLCRSGFSRGPAPALQVALLCSAARACTSVDAGVREASEEGSLVGGEDVSCVFSCVSSNSSSTEVLHEVQYLV